MQGGGQQQSSTTPSVHREIPRQVQPGGGNGGFYGKTHEQQMINLRALKKHCREHFFKLLRAVTEEGRFQEVVIAKTDTMELIIILEVLQV